MRIIDSKTDFYDFYSKVYMDDAFTFDRRGSYILKDEDFKRSFHTRSRGMRKEMDGNFHQFVVLQCGFTYWLFDIKVTEITEYGICKEYELTLINTWKDYEKPGVPLDLFTIIFPWYVHIYKDYINEMRQNEYERDLEFSQYRTWNENKVIHYPILKDTAITNIICGEDIYFAIEEYFSVEKSRTERTETIGLTDADKITNHGFNLKSSFRG